MPCLVESLSPKMHYRPLYFLPEHESGLSFLTLSQTTNFRLFQTERVCRRNLNLMKMEESSPKSRKHCGKSRNCSLRAISTFPAVFSKDLYCRHVKTRACLAEG